MRGKFEFRGWLAAFSLFLAAGAAHAQWLTETFQLSNGWSAVYPSIDATYDSLDDLVGADPSNPIQEIWMWRPVASVAQSVQDPQLPTGVSSQWISWVRGTGAQSALHFLPGNQAYLVRSTNSYTWRLKGRVVAPNLQWTSSGLNFIGFPAVPQNPPSIDQYLSPAQSFESSAQFFYYPGGPLGANNPQQLYAFAALPMTRGQGYWVRSSAFNSYFGPVTVDLGSSSGINFSDNVSQFSFYLRNQTTSPLTIYLRSVPSETAPNGQATVKGNPTLLLRGPVNLTNLTYGYTLISDTNSVVLAPQGQQGSDVQVVIGLNRSAITNAPGDLVAEILRITDGLGLSQIDIPVTAKAATTQGLWVGTAVVDHINQYLTTYYTATNDSDLANILSSLNLTNGVNGVSYQIDANSGRIIALSPTNGNYLIKQINQDPGTVAQPFNLRLIIHSGTNTAAGNAAVTLLKQVYVGFDTASNQVVATAQSFLDPNQLSVARRITATHLPWSPSNQGWIGSSTSLTQGTNIAFNLTDDYRDQASNPFLHTYHPDHNNLSADFSKVLDPGIESFNINRNMRLFFNPPANDFASLTAVGSHLQGAYAETITLSGATNQARQFDVTGSFTLNRITSTGTLTAQ